MFDKLRKLESIIVGYCKNIEYLPKNNMYSLQINRDILIYIDLSLLENNTLSCLGCFQSKGQAIIKPEIFCNGINKGSLLPITYYDDSNDKIITKITSFVGDVEEAPVKALLEKVIFCSKRSRNLLISYIMKIDYCMRTSEIFPNLDEFLIEKCIEEEKKWDDEKEHYTWNSNDEKEEQTSDFNQEQFLNKIRKMDDIELNMIIDDLLSNCDNESKQKLDLIASIIK